ncbi:class I tRNA ligase family protein [Patescibacteria group bacterium]|jgi:leucyl-tRNA synthetase|nr:class I tRNA ligase family protein [Patescibacteria group bacterium]
MHGYDHRAIEAKWQKRWAEQGLYRTNDNESGKENYYCLVEYPYPSGNLHIGHWYAFAVPDIFARYKRMAGYNVLFPIGFDSFGLPAENAAIKHGVDPKKWTNENIMNMSAQLASMGNMFDWERKVVASDPDYYRWTQALFLKLYEAGLAYRSTELANWCPKDLTVLANEQVREGVCERCGTPVEKRQQASWFLRITDYAERLLSDLDDLDWPEEIKESQRNWIGKSEGSLITFVLSRKNADQTRKNAEVNTQNARAKTSAQKEKVVIIHGCPSRSEKALDPPSRTYDKHWLPWTEEQMKKRGYNVHRPLMPEPWDAEYDAWKAELEKVDIDESTTLVGTSCGGAFLVRWLGESKHRIKQLCLVSPAYGPRDKPATDSADTDLYHFDLDPSVAERVDDIVIYTSDNDPYRAHCLHYHEHIPGSRLIDLPNHGHFLERDMGTIEFPELIDAITSCQGETSPKNRQGFTSENEVEIFTTRPDTLFGATYLVLAPEHELVARWLEDGSIENRDETLRYIERSRQMKDIERTAEGREKTGVRLGGVTAINPANQEEIPVFIADYVLAHYGTGAIMAVPAHDERDFEFAKTFDLPIKQVVAPSMTMPAALAPRPELETIKRDGVNAIIIHPDTEHYLILEEPREDGHIDKHFVAGGIDDQNIIDALRNEVIEESGFINFDIEETPVTTCAVESCRHHKQVNYRSISRTFLVRLKDLTKQHCEADEGRHALRWCTEAEITEELNWPGHIFGWAQFLQQHAVPAEGFLIESGAFSEMNSEEAKRAITKFVGGEMTATYRLRDWSLSRQRYWGCPIPIVYDPEGNPHPVPEEHLPWTLPEDVDFTPTGKAPLATSTELFERTERIFGKGWTPEVDTFDTFVDSSWYYLRYTDAKNEKEFASREKLDAWLPVNRYSGGAEHTTMHVLYSRFWHKALFDLGLVPSSEPYRERMNRGQILGPDGKKMSKSKGNVVDPDEHVARVGADTVKMYLAFMGPYNVPGNYPFDLGGIAGMRRYLERVVRLSERIGESVEPDRDTERLLHQTIKKVGEDIEAYKFNTAIAQLMTLLNHLEKHAGVSAQTYLTYLRLLAPFAPHLTEELWEGAGQTSSIHLEPWPTFDAEKLAAAEVTIVVQINGKVRAHFTADPDLAKDEAISRALEHPTIKGKLGHAAPAKTIYVPGKLVNLVVPG